MDTIGSNEAVAARTLPGGMRPDAAARYRWALEPGLAVLYVAAWALSTIRFGTIREFGAILLLATAIGLSRLSPAAALSVGALSVVAQLAGIVPLLGPSAWALPVAAAVVFFAAGVWGSRAARWWAFTAALVLAVGGAFVSGVLAMDRGGAVTDWPTLFGQLPRFTLSYVAVGSILAAVLVGAWFAGLTLNGRSAAGARPLTAASWILQPGSFDPGAGSPIQSRIFRPLTRRQVAADALIAAVFCLASVTADATASAAPLNVLLVFGLALVFRRLCPPLALAIAWLAAVLQMGLGLGLLNGDFAALAVLYASAAYGRRPTRWAGLASAVVGALLAAAYLSLAGRGVADLLDTPAVLPAGSDLVRFVATLVACVAVLGLAWTAGQLVRTGNTARESKRLEARAVEEQRAAQRSVIVEQERNRIARDMHDVVAHSLAVVIAQADGARYARANDPDAVDTALSTISATAREALGDVRILLDRLRHDQAGGPQPVLADLDRLVDQMRGAGLSIALRRSGTPLPLGSGQQLAIYRVVQEALTNALRHGEPGSDVRVRIDWDGAGITATVDNAVREGTNGERLEGIGHGLPGMRERALLAGGTLAVESPGGRFVISAFLPALAAHAAPTDRPAVHG